MEEDTVVILSMVTEALCQIKDKDHGWENELFSLPTSELEKRHSLGD
jgi:hypothetical protein